MYSLMNSIIKIESNEIADEMAMKSSATPGRESLNMLGSSVKSLMSSFETK